MLPARRFDLGSASFIVNESDDHALEQAILLKEAGGGNASASWPWTSATWTTPSTPRRPRGPTGSSRFRWRASLPSPRAAAALYAAAVKSLSPDLVLVGVQAHDELDGGLSPFLAAALGLPYVGRHLRRPAGAEAGTVSVCKEFPGAVMARMNVKLPAVLGIVAPSNRPATSRSPRFARR